MTEEKTLFTFEDAMQWISLLMLPVVVFIAIDAREHVSAMPVMHKAFWIFAIILVASRALKLVSRLYKKAFNKAD